MVKDTDRKTVDRREPLNATRIATEALRLIDETGLDGFSFRILAARLGCQAMSIYHYFPSKAHLFEALVDICIAEAPVPPPDGRPWRARLQEASLAFRGIAHSHPGFFLYFAVFRMNNRSGLGFLEAVLSIFAESGLDTEASARHFRALGYYLMGAGLDESMGYMHGPSAVDPVPEDEARRDFPAITAAGAYFGRAHHEATFLHGLNILLDRVEADAAARRAARSGMPPDHPPAR